MDAIRATYADIKTVRTRKVFQIVFEAPIEQMGDAMRLFGPPTPDAEVWAGIARLDLSKPSASDGSRAPAKLSQIAGIACNEPAFWRFLSERGEYAVDNADAAAQYVRLICSVKSRAELDTNVHAATLWRALKADFEAWKLAP